MRCPKFKKKSNFEQWQIVPIILDIDIKSPEQTYQSRPEQDKKNMEHKEDLQNLHNKKER